MERRDFLKTATAASVSAAIPLNAQTSQATSQPTKRAESPNMIYRELGTTGERVSAIGLGGYHLGQQKDSAESIQLIHAGVDRHHAHVTTPYGDIRVKIGTLNGQECNIAPEFEDCRTAATKHNVPLKLVQQAAIAAYLK